MFPVCSILFLDKEVLIIGSFNREHCSYLMMTLASLFWAGTFVSGKIAAAQFPTFSLSFLRFSIASLIILPLTLYLEHGKIRVPLRDLPKIVSIGALGFLGNNVLFLTACKYTSAVNLSSIAATCPLMTALLARMFLGEPLGWKRIVAILTAFLGVLVVLYDGHLSRLMEMNFNRGDLIQAMGILLLAAYGILSRKNGSSYSPMVIVCYGLVFSSLVTFPLMLAEKPGVYMIQASADGWLSIAYMALFASVGAYTLQQFAIKEIGPSRSMAFLNLIPIFSLFLAFWILHENITVMKIMGTLLVVSGVLLNAGSSRIRKI